MLIFNRRNNRIKYYDSVAQIIENILIFIGELEFILLFYMPDI